MFGSALQLLCSCSVPALQRDSHAEARRPSSCCDAWSERCTSSVAVIKTESWNKGTARWCRVRRPAGLDGHGLQRPSGRPALRPRLHPRPRLRLSSAPLPFATTHKKSDGSARRPSPSCSDGAEAMSAQLLGTACTRRSAIALLRGLHGSLGLPYACSLPQALASPLAVRRLVVHRHPQCLRRALTVAAAGPRVREGPETTAHAVVGSPHAARPAGGHAQTAAQGAPVRILNSA